VIRYRVLISGRVQGVSFRAVCRQRAQQLGVAGWVRNLADGRVEAVFEGPAGAVERLLDWARRGPRLAEVASVAAVPQAAEGLDSFVIR
jgi:acylphosphatase